MVVVGWLVCLYVCMYVVEWETDDFIIGRGSPGASASSVLSFSPPWHPDPSSATS